MAKTYMVPSTKEEKQRLDDIGIEAMRILCKFGMSVEQANNALTELVELFKELKR